MTTVSPGRLVTAEALPSEYMAEPAVRRNTSLPSIEEGKVAQVEAGRLLSKHRRSQIAIRNAVLGLSAFLRGMGNRENHE